MTWSIRARLTAWHSLVVVLVVATGAISVAFVQQRLALKRLDGEIQRLMLTLEGVMRTEFNEGLDLQGAADEASSEVVAPDRTLMLTRTDGVLLAKWGQPLAPDWRPLTDISTVETLALGSTRLRLLSRPVIYQDHNYVAAVIAPLEDLEFEQAELLLALAVGVLIAFGVAGLGGWLVGRQTLRPLTDMAQRRRHRLKSEIPRLVYKRRTRRTNWVDSPPRSMGSWIGWPRRSTRSGSSWPMHRTSCVRLCP